MNLIPKEKVEEIKAAANMIDVLQRLNISGKSVGINQVFECPFHGGKSLNVKKSSPLFYKCYGCGKSGNAVNFLMDHKRLTFPEALKALAEQFNVVI